MRGSALVPFAALLCAAGLSAQQVWIVDAAAGPGHDFTTVTDAVAASSNGDTIRVRAGFYAEPGRITFRHGLKILGEGEVVLSRPAGRLATDDSGQNFRVLYQLEDEPVTIRGFTLQHDDGTPGSVTVGGAYGLVSLQDLRGPLLPSGRRAALSGIGVSSCERVHLHRLFGWGCTARFAFTEVSMTRCVLHGSVVRAESTLLHVDLSLIDNQEMQVTTSPIELFEARVEVSRSVLRSVPPQRSFQFGAPAIRAFNGFSSAAIDPTTNLTAPFGVAEIDGMPSTVSYEEIPTLITNTSWNAQGSVLELDLHGRTGSVVGTFFSLPPPATNPLPIRLPYELWLDPVNLYLLDLVALTGRDRQLTIPLGRGLPPGLMVVVQSVEFGAEIDFSNGTIATFR